MARIKVKSAKEIELIRDAGALAAETLILAGEMCKPGVSTLEIDEFIGDYTNKHKGRSAREVYDREPSYFAWIDQGSFSLDTKAQFARIRKLIDEEKKGPASPEALKDLADKFNGGKLF